MIENYANGAPSGYQTITDGKIEPGQSVFGAIVIAAGNDVVVTVNGVATVVNIPAGPKTFYCFAVTEAAEFDVVIKAIGNVTVTNNTEATYELQSFLYAGAPSNYKVITDGKIEAGQAIYGAIVVSSETPVVVTVNGVATVVNIPAGANTFYCFAVAEAGNYEVVIDDVAPVNGIVTVTNESGITYELQSFLYEGAPSNYQVITNGEIVPGASVFGAIVVSADTPVVVTVNGVATTVNIPAGANTFYCFSVKEAGDYAVVITPAS